MLTRWSDLDRAFSTIDDLQRRVNRLFEGYDARRGPPPARGAGPSFPPVNLYDAGDDLLNEALVPGLSEGEITITGNEKVLAISGARRLRPPEGYSVHRQERGSINFSRSFTFPCRIDMEKASATVKDGVLTVKLAKAAEARPRQIAVKAR